MQHVTTQNATEVAKAVSNGEHRAKSLAEAMHRVMEQVGYVQKDKKMEFGSGYKYAGEAAFIAALRPELVKQGIVVCPVGQELLAAESVAGAKGSQNRVVLKVTFRFTHAPTGDTLDIVVCGEGMDVGDKATNKAQTAALKYALRQSFIIETGNDPDDTPSREQERAAPPKPVAQPAPANKPEPKYADKDNLPMRASITQGIVRTKDKPDLDAYWVRSAVAARDNGQLSKGDWDNLISAAKDQAKAFGAPVAAK